MKLLAFVFGALILLIQYPLWLGKGGWLRAWEMDRRLEGERAKNRQLEARNAALAAEVRDLKQGTEAIEERARYELGMIRDDEVFFQIVEPQSTTVGTPQSATVGTPQSATVGTPQSATVGTPQSATSGSKNSH